MKGGLNKKLFIALNVLSASHCARHGNHNDFCTGPGACSHCASGIELDFADGRSETAFSVLSGKEE